MSQVKYLIVLEGNGQCAAYDSLDVAWALAQGLSTRAGAHFIAVPQREDHTPALVAALELVDEVWHRANLHPEINFLGDDEHEAWSAVRAALALAKGE